MFHLDYQEEVKHTKYFTLYKQGGCTSSLDSRLSSKIHLSKTEQAKMLSYHYLKLKKENDRKAASLTEPLRRMIPVLW